MQHTIIGIVGTDPRTGVTNSKQDVTSFRVAETTRRFDNEKNEWVDGRTNWFTAVAYGALARNVAKSILKGQRVILTGELSVRDWEAQDRSGTNVEITLSGVGHDLQFGTSEFSRYVPNGRDDDATPTKNAESVSTGSTPVDRGFALVDAAE